MDELMEMMDVVVHLNDKYNSIWMEENGLTFTFESNGSVDVILFGSHQLWCSEDDEREWDDDLDDYTETIYHFCDKKFEEYVDNLFHVLDSGKLEG